MDPAEGGSGQARPALRVSPTPVHIDAKLPHPWRAHHHKMSRDERKQAAHRGKVPDARQPESAERVDRHHNRTGLYSAKPVTRLTAISSSAIV